MSVSRGGCRSSGLGVVAVRASKHAMHVEKPFSVSAPHRKHVFAMGLLV